jgi:hypothetical protein
MPHSGGAVRQPWPINSSAAAQKDATDTPLQRGECSGCGCPPSFDLASLIRGPLRYSFSGVLASDNRFITTSLAGVGVGMVEQGPDPYSIRYRHRGTYSAATQATDYKMRLYPTRLRAVVRTGPTPAPSWSR